MLEPGSDLTDPRLLDFHLRRLQARNPVEIRMALRALAALDSPRALAPAARLFLTIEDQESLTLIHSLLERAPAYRSAGQEALWGAIYTELETALDDPERVGRASEALTTLRGNSPK